MTRSQTRPNVVLDRVNTRFPGALEQAQFLVITSKRLSDFAFYAANSIACVDVCRDEITQSFVEGVQHTWGEAFNLSSLGGLLLVGKTGLAAALAHAPDGYPLRHYVFFCMTHIGIDEVGRLGACRRPRQSGVSGACGALLAFHSQLLEGRVNLELDPDDLEQSLLRRRLYPLLASRPAPSLEELTRLAHDAIVEDLERAIALTVTPGSADYAVFTGIQIHAPEGHLVWPGTSYAVVAGVRRPLALKP